MNVKCVVKSSSGSSPSLSRKLPTTP